MLLFLYMYMYIYYLCALAGSRQLYNFNAYGHVEYYRQVYIIYSGGHRHVTSGRRQGVASTLKKKSLVPS